MLKKIVIGLIAFLIIVTGGVFYYLKISQVQSTSISEADLSTLTVMPLPSKLSFDEDTLFIPRSLGAQFNGFTNTAMESAVNRFFKQVSGHYADRLSKKVSTYPFLIVHCEKSTKDDDVLTSPESYTLHVDDENIILRAPRPSGILHGLKTLYQLIESNSDKVWIRSVHVEDSPRYHWRGLMIDVCRHWIPKDIILRNLEAMATLKMNVLHLHLSDYQAFRIESKKFPKLHEMGSNGSYYTQNDIKDIIEYAAERGIRVVPEFDLPGHSTSWLAGYPVLASTPGTYAPDTVYGILNPVIDPSKDIVYDFFDQFFEEMAVLFPDPYVHIGGDEVNPGQWNQNPKIRAFMKQHKLNNSHDLQAYFNKRINKILTRHGKIMAGWDEIQHSDLPQNIVVQAWRNQKSLFDAVRKGNKAVLSAGYYLDHKLPAGKYYTVDPDILPNAVDIEPDTAHWKEYDLTIGISQNELHSTLVMYGTPSDYRGFLGMMENKTPFTSAKVDEEEITFTIPSDYGKIKFQLNMTEDSINGTGSISLIKLKIKGVKKGGDDMPGTSPPDIQRIKPLTTEEKSMILGGEACMWTELSNANTIESRIWPRTAAIAEKLWSSATQTQNEDDMYRRLKYVDMVLTKGGLKHHSNYLSQLHNIAGVHNITPLKTFVDILEEVKYYDRMRIYDDLTVFTPLNQIVDAAWPESLTARDFNIKAKQLVEHPDSSELKKEIIAQLRIWKLNHHKLEPITQSSPRLSDVIQLSVQLSKISGILIETLHADSLSEDAKADLLTMIQEAEHPVNGVLLAVVPGLKQLARK